MQFRRLDKVTTLHFGDYKESDRFAMIPTLQKIIVERSGGTRAPTTARASGRFQSSRSAPAIANAIYDAVGASIKSLPQTAEKVLAGHQKSVRLRDRTREIPL
jgi:CO/xanthine dehydrogenase Mo-binding subunit